MADAIATVEDAILRANALTGLATISGPPSAEMVTVEDDVTPYLGERNVGKAAWQIIYPDASLRFQSAEEGFRDPYLRTFLVILEAATGRLFFVTSTYLGEPDPDMRPMPSCDVATQQLSDEDEVYEAYPDEDPEITFLAALERVLGGGVGSPFMAKSMHGAYVLHSRGSGETKHVWAITLRGLPPIRARGPEGDAVPVWQRNHMRNVVNAMTGAVLFASNSPQPE